MGATATTEISAQLRGLLNAIRLLKQEHSAGTQGIPAGLAGVLATIGGPGACCHAKDLAARNALDPSTVSRAVAALVRAGLVRRSADPADGRASVLELTEQGSAALLDNQRRHDAVLADVLCSWTSEDIALFSALLQRFSADVLARLGRPQTVTPQNNLEAAR